MTVEPGYKYRIFWSKGNLNNATIHIRAIVDKDQVVYCEWLRSKQMWWYQIKSIYWFNLLEKGGQLTKIGKSKFK